MRSSSNTGAEWLSADNVHLPRAKSLWDHRGNKVNKIKKPQLMAVPVWGLIWLLLKALWEEIITIIIIRARCSLPYGTSLALKAKWDNLVCGALLRITALPPQYKWICHLPMDTDSTVRCSSPLIYYGVSDECFFNTITRGYGFTVDHLVVVSVWKAISMQLDNYELIWDAFPFIRKGGPIISSPNTEPQWLIFIVLRGV